MRNRRCEEAINKKWAENKRIKEDKEEEKKEEEKGKDEEEKEKQEEKDEEENKKIKRKNLICVSEGTHAIRRAESKFERCRPEEHSAVATADGKAIKTWNQYKEQEQELEQGGKISTDMGF